VDRLQDGQFFREAWIAGVKRHYEGTPKPSYISPWQDMQEWEQASAIAVYQQVRQFVELSTGQTQHLSREQRGRFVCLCWIAQIWKHIASPKPSYVADWEMLPAWQQETDADIFDAIEQATLQKEVRA
jgi:hypothetical protein